MTRCEVSAAMSERRPPMPYRCAGELCSLNQLKMLITDAALIGWDVAVRMTGDRVYLRSTTRTVSFPRSLGDDGVWTVGEEWKEEDHAD
jgi:hypothetical protein